MLVGPLSTLVHKKTLWHVPQTPFLSLFIFLFEHELNLDADITIKIDVASLSIHRDKRFTNLVFLCTPFFSTIKSHSRQMARSIVLLLSYLPIFLHFLGAILISAKELLMLNC